MAEKPPLKSAELEDAPSGSVFEMPALTGSWARCMEGLRHPHTQKLRPITFDHDVAKNRDDVVLVHLNHRLVQMCLRLMRAEVWAQDDVKKLHRVEVRTVSDSQLDSPAVAVVSRLVITGGTHHRLHEELTVSGGYLKDGSFSRETRVTQVNQWLEEALPHEADETSFDDLSNHFAKNENAIQRALEARSGDRLRNLRNTLETRKQQEIKNIISVLDELTRTIEQELRKEHEPEQLALFTEDERTQVRRDTAALRARLSRIPEEKEQEIQAIEHRYKDFVARTFPVAVIFLVPESLAGKGSFIACCCLPCLFLRFRNFLRERESLHRPRTRGPQLRTLLPRGPAASCIARERHWHRRIPRNVEQRSCRGASIKRCRHRRRQRYRENDAKSPRYHRRSTTKTRSGLRRGNRRQGENDGRGASG